MNKKICLFVSSSDNTLDVLRQVIMSFDVCWPECPFAKFVGLNSVVDATAVCGFHPIYAPVSGWRAELLEQILQLPEQCEYIMLFLDDFLILSPVNSDRLRILLNAALRRELDYLRLAPQNRAAIPEIAKRIFCKTGDEIEPIGVRSPYYSSLQVALWKRSHLIEMLKLNEKHIWAFEHQIIDGNPHFAIVGPPPIRYVHVVEKGRWQPYSKGLFGKLNFQFNPGNRIVLGHLATLTLCWNRIKFGIVGYGVVRIKRYFRNRLTFNTSTQDK